MPSKLTFASAPERTETTSVSPAETPLDYLVTQAEASFHAARSSATRRAYEHDWREFRRWCEQHSLVYLPAAPQSLILYATDLTKNHNRKWNTLQRRLAAVSQRHQQAGFEPPTRAWAVQQFLAGLRRELGIAPERKRPVLAEDLRQMLTCIPETLLGIRDRALLLLGFTGAFRRSELVALDVEDMEQARGGLIVHIRRSKTDQEGEGRRIGIPQGREETTCPVQAIDAWRSAAEISYGALFRVMNRHGHILPKRLSGEAVALIVKRYVTVLGFDPAAFAAHSLRAGLATSAAAAGKSERTIMRQTGHRSLTIARRYIRDGELFRDNAADMIGL